MKKYLITVNGNQYEVDVEEMPANSDAEASVMNAGRSVNHSQNLAPENPVIKSPVPKSENPQVMTEPGKMKTAPTPPATPVKTKKGSEIITSPMPGTILKIAVTDGQIIKKGQVLCILEAMKMENEIVSPRDATIAGILVSRGASVNAGDPLISFE